MGVNLLCNTNIYETYEQRLRKYVSKSQWNGDLTDAGKFYYYTKSIDDVISIIYN